MLTNQLHQAWCLAHTYLPITCSKACMAFFPCKVKQNNYTSQTTSQRCLQHLQWCDLVSTLSFPALAVRSQVTKHGNFQWSNLHKIIAQVKIVSQGLILFPVPPLSVSTGCKQPNMEWRNYNCIRRCSHDHGLLLGLHLQYDKHGNCPVEKFT